MRFMLFTFVKLKSLSRGNLIAVAKVYIISIDENFQSRWRSIILSAYDDEAFDFNTSRKTEYLSFFF